MASRRPPRPLLASPTSLRPYISPCTSSCASLCTRNTPTHATEPQFPCAAPRPRRSTARPAAVAKHPPPLNPLRLRARPLHRRTVSINPRPISLPFTHSSVPASSPKQPCRPLPVQAAGEARSPPLDPSVTCACAPSTFCSSPWSERWPGAPSRANAGELPPRAASLRRRRRRPRVHTCRAIRSCMDGPDRVPLRVMRPVHRGPVHRAHGAVHRTSAHR
jgi:hypothetical protein